MNKVILERINNIQEVEPDEIDKAMIAMIDNDDNTLYTMRDVEEERLKNGLKVYNGKISLRVPRSLHQELIEEAEKEGVSLNQYALYKLSKL